MTLGRAVGRGPSWKGVCALRTVNEEEAVPFSRWASWGLGGQTPRIHNVPRVRPGPARMLKMTSWILGHAVESPSFCHPGASLSPHFLLFRTVNTFLLTWLGRGSRNCGAEPSCLMLAGAAGRSRSHSLTESLVTIECKGDTSFLFRDRSLSACIYRIRN